MPNNEYLTEGFIRKIIDWFWGKKDDKNLVKPEDIKPFMAKLTSMGYTDEKKILGMLKRANEIAEKALPSNPDFKTRKIAVIGIMKKFVKMDEEDKG